MNSDIAESERRISNRLVSLIDIIFAVAVGDSIFALIFSDPSINNWPELDKILTISNMSLFVAYCAVVLSWTGYHNMIENFPYRSNFWGKARFCVDLFVVFTYIYFIYSKNNFSLFLFLFIIIFFLYGIGDMIRDLEYDQRVSQRSKSFIFMILFLCVYISYHINILIALGISRLIILIINFLLLIIYRKIRLGF